MFSTRSKVNLPMLLKVTGWLMMIEAAFMVLPLITSLVYGEMDSLAFLGAAIVTGIVGVLMTSFIRPSRTDLAKRDGFLLTAMIWVVFSFFGIPAETAILVLVRQCRDSLQQALLYSIKWNIYLMGCICGAVSCNGLVEWESFCLRLQLSQCSIIQEVFRCLMPRLQV